MKKTDNTETGRVKDWHDPHDEGCPQNYDHRNDCTCKRPMKRKPYRVVKVTDNGVNHNVNPKLILEIYPHNGVIAIREKRRKKRYYSTTADIYSGMVRSAAFAAIAAKKKARKDRLAARRKKSLS